MTNKTPLYIVYDKSPLNVKTYRLKRWRKMYHVNTNQGKAGVAILISGRADFKVGKVIRNKEERYIMIKGGSQ